ncbi:DUF1028 domain-containing protein [Pedobacter caeni]|uniref:Uncharacterized conserved protein, Ntn-hydrolase superfamily n=1 Tax=Pedobacter caeni TaxID=288992 RepID=A0A1M5NDE1_9SPHI|nr:DUF1028 domain-containing protein [Pedobacter caeni]SHG87209.1 Uncharacterized conserved protein, Ntn-hydrolase superfamily [Pedobacter caeni]
MLSLLLAFTMNVKATWSIIVIDPRTKKIGIAGASCTFSVYGIGGIIPGKGAIVVQAMSNKAARNKGLQMILADASPQEILEAIRKPEFDPEQQQYGIVCLNAMDKPQTYTGTETNAANGSATSKGISIQGNTLNNNKVFNKILQVVIKAQKASMSIQDVLMLALEAGAEYGGDKRCGDRKASSAFLTVAKPGDDPQHPGINLIYNQQDETTNAVKGLRKKFEDWKRQEQGSK